MSAYSPMQVLVGRLLLPTDNFETRFIERLEHCDSKFFFRLRQEPKRPEAPCNFHSNGSRYDRDGFVGEHQGKL